MEHIWENAVVLASPICTCVSSTHQSDSRRTPRFPAPLHLGPFSPPDRDRRVDSPALSARGSDLPGAPQDEAGLTSPGFPAATRERP